MSNSIFIPIIDNGMGLCRAKWACSLFDSALSGCFAGRKVTWMQISYPYPSAACNIMAHQFLQSGCDELFLHDIDIIYSPQQLTWLLSHDVPYVGGIIPKRVMGLELAIYPHEPMAKDPFAPGVKPLINADCGRGFVRIHRDVFEIVKTHIPTYLDDQEAGGNGALRYEFFQSKPGGHSEDFAFCELYRKLGGTPYVDQRIMLHHEGSAVYPIKGTY